MTRIFTGIRVDVNVRGDKPWFVNIRERSDTAADRAAEIVEDGLITVREAERLSGLSRTTLYAAMAAGQLAYAKFGRARRIPRRSLMRFAASKVCP